MMGRKYADEELIYADPSVRTAPAGIGGADCGSSSPH